jgi:hypothetical protein
MPTRTPSAFALEREKAPHIAIRGRADRDAVQHGERGAHDAIAMHGMIAGEGDGAGGFGGAITEVFGIRGGDLLCVRHFVFVHRQP